MKKILLFLLLVFPIVAKAQLELPFSIKLVNSAPIDFWYFESDGTPYDNTGEVTTQVLSAIRYIGQTFNVNGVEYWFKDGITDGDLIAKGGGSVDTTAFIKTQGESILTDNVSVSDVTGNKYLSINLGDQSLGTVPYSILNMGTINGGDVGYVTLQSGNTDQTLESTISLINGVIEIISPIIKLKDTSTSGYVWTASGTDGTGGWAAPSGGSGANALGTYLVQTATNAPANAQIMGSLATGIVKNTTTTGVQSIAVAADFPTLNQNTTGNAATVTTNANLTGDVTSTGNATAIASGVIVNADINASAAIGATKLIDGSITDTELGYINTLSSNAQTQITAREVLTNKATDLSTFNSTLYPTTASLFARRDVTGTDAIVQADNGKTIYFNSGSPFNFTIDALTTNSSVYFYNKGSATVTFVDGSGVTSTGVTSLAAGESGGIIYESSTTPIILGTPSGGGGLTVGTSTITSGTNTKVLYNNSGVLGEYTVSGTGNVALTTSPTFTTPALGTPSALVGTNITGTATGLTSGITNALKSATTTVNVSSATAPTSGQVLTATSGTAATWQTPASASGAWLLASGGTATGTNTFAMGSNPFILTSGVTTGTGATAGIQNVFNSLTTGNGLDISSSSTTTGAIEKITSTSTGLNNTKGSGGLLTLLSSGAYSSSSRTGIGASLIMTNTGTTSTNIPLYVSATGATTNNAIEVGGGDIILSQGSQQKFLKSGGVFNIGVSDYNTLALVVQNTNRVIINGSSGAFTFTTNAVAAGSITPYTFNDFARTNQTASTESNFTRWTPSTTQFATGTQSLLRAYRMEPATYSFVGASDITNAYTLWVDKPVASTNATILQKWAAGFDGNVGINESLIIGTSTISSVNDRVKINGTGTTTGKGLVVNNSSGSERFSVQDDGVINFSGSGGTAGQVLESNGTSAPAWTNSKVSVTGSNQLYQVQVINISSGLVASGTGFAGINANGYANKTVLSVDFVIAMIKNDGTAVVYGKLTSIFRKNNSGTWTADVPGTPTISDITQLSGFVGDINGGVPGITWTTPGTTSGTWQLGYTAAISSTTN